MASIHGDVASAIGQQVEQMILQAKKDSEARVKHDLANTKTQLKHMEGLVEELAQRIARCRANNAGGAAAQAASESVDRNFLTSKVSQLEQKWGAEVKALKQDLHRTILAHNHNSDLMRHHRDALEDARKKLEQHSQPKAAEVEQQIEKVERVLKAGMSKQALLDQLDDRLKQLEQHFNDTIMPGIPYPGMADATAAMMQQQRAATAKQQRGGYMDPKDDGVTEDDVRSRVNQAMRESANRTQNLTFNKEAPVFVPGATPTGEGTASAGDAFGTGEADDEEEEDPISPE